PETMVVPALNLTPGRRLLKGPPGIGQRRAGGSALPQTHSQGRCLLRTDRTVLEGRGQQPQQGLASEAAANPVAAQQVGRFVRAPLRDGLLKGLVGRLKIGHGSVQRRSWYGWRRRTVHGTPHPRFCLSVGDGGKIVGGATLGQPVSSTSWIGSSI